MNTKRFSHLPPDSFDRIMNRRINHECNKIQNARHTQDNSFQNSQSKFVVIDIVRDPQIAYEEYMCSQQGRDIADHASDDIVDGPTYSTPLLNLRRHTLEFIDARVECTIFGVESVANQGEDNNAV